jgi:dimethylargininase
MSNFAITRGISAAMGRCELVYKERQTIDLELAQEQHAAYERVIEDLGYQLIRLPVMAGHPCSAFVDDTAVVLDELAIITRPGAESRRAEVGPIAEALAPYRKLIHMKAPCTMDGGDVLRIDKTLFVGHSKRTNRKGIERLRRIVKPHGYSVRKVTVHGCTHLKAAVSQVAPGAVLINPERVDPGDFDGLVIINVAAGEPDAANTLLLSDHVLVPSGCTETCRQLDALGIPVIELADSELIKAESGLSGCTLVFRHPAED